MPSTAAATSQAVDDIAPPVKRAEAAWSEQLDEFAQGLRLIATEPLFELVADGR
jgi:hypothetical protein